MLKHRIWAVILLILAVFIGYFVYSSQIKADSSFPFKLGLDLSGGTHLVYEADVTSVASSEVASSMDALRDVIERRVNVFGVSEPIVQIESGNAFGSIKNRLIVELPGVTNVDEAVAAIGQTPILEFRLVAQGVENLDEVKDKPIDQVFLATGLTGRLLEHSKLEFDQQTGEGIVVLSFNKEGGDLFEKITKENIGRYLAIFLDGDLKSMPVIREAITGGTATISGGFIGKDGLVEARDLVRNLNLGALPVPIKLVSTQTIGASLGEAAVDASMKAGALAFIIVALFLIVWYRLPGLVAVISLAVYVALNLVIFKLIPVTLTAAGIAGFILSIGMAVDANILIFERMKEEMKRGRVLSDAVYEGFTRAWLSIRDSNLSSIITAVILFSFASTALVKGFALVFFIGVIVSMFTAITVSRTLLLSVTPKRAGKLSNFMFGNGLS